MTQDHILWAYRLLLDREPEDQNYGNMSAEFEDSRELRNHFLESAEYHTKNANRTNLRDTVVICELGLYGVKGRIFVNLSDTIGLNVTQGTYEREEIDFVKSNLTFGQTFVDLGANIGLFSVVASSIVGDAGKVFAFEPLTANIVSLKKSIVENSFCRNVTVIQAIVGDKPRSDMFIAYQSLQDGSGNSGGSFIVSAEDQIPSFMKREAIRQDTLDNLIGAVTPVHFIKMDIEGAEGLAVRGAKSILTKQAPINCPRSTQTSWRSYQKRTGLDILI